MNSEKFNLNNRQLFNLALILILLLSLLFLISLYSSRTIRNYEGQRVVQVASPFENIELEARSAIVYEIKSRKILYEKDSRSVRPLASVTKVLSAVTALDLLPPERLLQIPKQALLEEGDSGLYRDEKWKLQDLIDFSLTASSNDGIAAIAAAAAASYNSNLNYEDSLRDFVYRMNKKAAEIGMKKSYFLNETGLDLKDGRSGGYSTAYDTALLFTYALRKYPEIFESTTREKIELKSDSNLKHKALNTNNGIKFIPGLIGSKTGYTELAGGNLAILLDAGVGRPFVIVVLGSSLDGRIRDATLLSEKTYEYLSKESGTQ